MTKIIAFIADHLAATRPPRASRRRNSNLYRWRLEMGDRDAIRSRITERYAHTLSALPDDASVLDQSRLGSDIAENLRWLAQQSDRPGRVPCGELTGVFLNMAADRLERLAAKCREGRNE